MDARADAFEVNAVRVDFGTQTIRDSAGTSIALRPQAFAVLHHLALNPDRLVTKDELMNAVWAGIAVTDDSLVQCIHDIRRALNDDAHAVLKTIPRRGYRLVVHNPKVAPPIAATLASAPPAAKPATPSPRILGIGAVALVLVTAAAFVLVTWLMPPPAVPSGAPVIAVLPFDNLGGDPDQTYFADGITEDLITDLSKISGVYVIARNSVWAYRERPVDPRQVAAELGASYVLEGSVRREGDDLRINAQLIDAATGAHLWADRYDGKVGGVFALQDQVIGHIVSALAVELSTAEVAATGEIETDNPLAYDAVLRGLEYLHHDTEADTLKAIELFESAAALDPHYARAHAALAAAHWRIVQSFWFIAAGAGWVHAYENYKTHLALAMERPSALAHATAAQQYQFEGRYEEAFDAIGKATAMAPGDAENHVVRARILNAIGRAVEAEAEVRVAMRLDPRFAPGTLRVLSVSLLHQRRYAEAVDAVKRIEAQGAVAIEDYWTLASAYGHLGRKDEARDAIDAYNALSIAVVFDPLSIEDTLYYWSGDAFDYHAPYMDDLIAGLRLAGAPEGAGSDLPLASYKKLMTRSLGEYDVAGSTKIDLATAQILHDRHVVFIDLRTEAEYRTAHIPGAIGLSLTVQLDKDTLAAAVPKDEEVVFYCHGKYCPTSPYGTAKALTWGWTKVYYFAGGFPAWHDAGLPVETIETQ